MWNEASAVGLQVALWLGLGAAAAMVWLGGAPALPYAVAVFVVLGAASWVSMLHAHKLGVRVDDAGRVLLRLVPYGVRKSFVRLAAESPTNVGQAMRGAPSASARAMSSVRTASSVGSRAGAAGATGARVDAEAVRTAQGSR